MVLSNINNTGRLRIIFYFSWLYLMLIQAFFTELLPDEAYYWMYSNQLSWGYFDHPPIVAVMIKAGYYLFPSELGVRFFMIIAGIFTVLTIEKMIVPKDYTLFYLLVSSVGILHFIGFFSLPDSPLLLTSSVFFLLYQSYTEKPSMGNSFLIGLTAALMILSKYHGFLIIGLVILSNFKLLTNRFFWLAFLVTVLTILPHVFWQIKMDFPSIKYHLFDRSVEPYSFNYSIEYIATQPFVLGPLTGILFLIAAYRFKARNQFEKSLQFTFWGTYVFFLLMTFKGRVEAHWTLIAIIPALFMGYHYALSMNNRRRFLIRIFYVSICLVIIARVSAMVNFLPDNNLTELINREYHGKKRWANNIYQIAGETPVVFMNSYAKASLYEFYSGGNAFSLNNIMGRKNQFDIWNMEEKYRGGEIMLIPNYEIDEFELIHSIKPKTRYCFIENFQSYSSIRLRPVEKHKIASLSDTLIFNIVIENPTCNFIDLEANPHFPSYICYQFFEGKALVKEECSIRLFNDIFNDTVKLSVVTPDISGNFSLQFSVRTGWLPPTINSTSISIKTK